MSPLFPAQRRAERFDSLVEGRRDDADRATDDLLELVGALRSVPEAQARPEFVADLRARLMVAAETTLVARPATNRDPVARLTVKAPRSRHERRVGVALGAVALLGATTSMAVASQSAIPGDALYPVKRAIENTQAGFSVGDDAKGKTIMGNASERLDEVDKLSQQDKPDAKLVIQTLDTFSQQFTDASHALLADYADSANVASIQQIHQNAAHSMDELQALDLVIPAAAHDALANAAAGVFAVDSDAVQLCSDPDCGDGLLELPATLVAGAAHSVDDAVTGTLAGGELPSTDTPGDDAGAGTGQQANGDKGGGKPSGLSPPETPITIPSDIPTTPSDSGNDLGNLVGDHHNGGNSGNHDNGGKGGTGKGLDLTPVSTAVNNVVSGVVEGVNGVLGGLTGGTTGNQ